MKLLMLAILGVAAVIGLWALAALFFAAARSGGVRRLFKSWLKAVAGG